MGLVLPSAQSPPIYASPQSEFIIAPVLTIPFRPPTGAYEFNPWLAAGSPPRQPLISWIPPIYPNMNIPTLSQNTGGGIGFLSGGGGLPSNSSSDTMSMPTQCDMTLPLPQPCVVVVPPVTPVVPVVPEPNSVALLLIGMLITLFFFGRKNLR